MLREQAWVTSLPSSAVPALTLPRKHLVNSTVSSQDDLPGIFLGGPPLGVHGNTDDQGKEDSSGECGVLSSSSRTGPGAGGGGRAPASRPRAEMGRHWPEAQELESKDKRNQGLPLLPLPLLPLSPQASVLCPSGHGLHRWLHRLHLLQACH